MKTQSDKPEHWEVQPDEFLGEYHDARFYRLGSDIYKEEDGSTRYFCTVRLWNAADMDLFIETGII